MWLLGCAFYWATHTVEQREPTAMQQLLPWEVSATKLFNGAFPCELDNLQSVLSTASDAMNGVYHPVPLSFAAARFAFMASFLALPPRPAFSCCLVIFGSAHGRRVSDGTSRRCACPTLRVRCGAVTACVRVMGKQCALLPAAKASFFFSLFDFLGIALCVRAVSRAPLRG